MNVDPSSPRLRRANPPASDFGAAWGLKAVTAWSSLAESELYPPARLVVLRNLRNATCVI